MYILIKGVSSEHLRETESSSSCLPISCIETAVKHMKVWKDRVTNFIKQNKNIQKQILKSGYKKFKKLVWSLQTFFRKKICQERHLLTSFMASDPDGWW
jgi:hypothetical protein